MAEQGRRIAPTRPTLFIDDILEITEHGDVFRAIVLSGSEVYSVACSPHMARKSVELLGRAVNKWDASNQAVQGIRSGRKR